MQLLDWFRREGRDFPWRHTRDPYHLLCVEVMLQRTRATIVERHFREFQKRFYRPQDFLKAGEKEAEKLFKAIGLHWRSSLFWEMHNQLVERFHGFVPKDFDLLISLPGVGQYAASAVCVFAFGHKMTVIDSNVLRILGRYYGIDFPDHARKSERTRRWASELAPRDPLQCREWNWALIDFGSLVCRPASPGCRGCPLRDRCRYALDTSVSD